MVTNGLYAAGGRAVNGTMTNRVAIDRAITVQSVNGPGVTIIQGARAPGSTNGDGAVRCVYLADGAALLGFTLTNGATRTAGDSVNEQSGGGVWCATGNSTVSNCIVAGNSAGMHGGGIYGGAARHCTLLGNSASYGGGASSSVLYDSILTANTARYGGGTYNSTLRNCVLSGNASVPRENNGAGESGGGASGGTLTACTITGNSAYAGGGVIEATLYGCVLTSNNATWGGGAYSSTLNNCTLVGNSADAVGGAYQGTLHNCILYFNTAAGSPNYYNDHYVATGRPAVNYCCTVPLPFGDGNITNSPSFQDLAGGNLRLQSNSPCINSGQMDMSTAFGGDFDGNPRVVGVSVDIGAYEFQTPGSILPYPWLLQCGLPTDGSADFTDPDGDGLNNWQEWRAGTIPTDALSALRMLSAVPGPSGVSVTWQSVANRSYLVQRAAALGAPPAFLTIQSNISGNAGTTTYTDTTASGNGPFFYRVGVQ
jgi:hypothetical protein